MKKLFLFFSATVVSVSGFAQQGGYTLAATADNVDCYYRIEQCNGKTVVLLRFNNRNTGPVNIMWKEAFNTLQLPQTTGGFKTKHAALPAGITEPAGCGDTQLKEMVIGEADVHPAYRADITGFEFSEVAVTPAP